MNDFYALAKKNISKFDHLVFEKLKVKHIYFLSLIYILVVYGFGIIPGNSSYLISKNPFINIFRDSLGGQYNYDSILAPMLAYFTGLNSSILTYSLFNLFIILSAHSLFIYIASKKFGSDVAKIFILLFLLSPFSTILFTWLGSYDSITYLLQTLLLLSTNAPFIFLLGLLGGMNHLPIVMISGTSLLLFRFANKEDKIGYTHILLLWVGLAIGLFIVKAYQQYSGLGINVDRMSYLKVFSLKHLIFDIWLSNWLILPFSFYNILWFVVLYIVYYLRNSYKNLLYIFIGSNICFVFFSFLGAADSTRIFSILSLPLLFCSFLFIVTQARLKGNFSYISLRKYFSATVLIGLFIPRIHLFDGNIYFSNFYTLFNFFKKMF